MISWNSFVFFAFPAILLWIAGAYFAFKNREKFASALTLTGIVIFGSFIAAIWISLERPPLRTMGETRLWYAFFLPLTSLITYIRWKYKWILSFSTILAIVFIAINIFRPEIHNKTLMPALQSPWFAPHVIVYMFSYAILGAATLVGIYLLFWDKSSEKKAEIILDNLVNTGTAFLTLGMLMGALWAKEAWGHYWSWDPKETWAAATWLGFLVYIHYRQHRPLKIRTAIAVLLVSFVLLQVCWYGINYLPSAKGASIHTYNID